MKEVKGKSVSAGIATGKIYLYKEKKLQAVQQDVLDIEEEKERFKRARQIVGEQLRGLYETALKEVGEEEAMIFLAHQLVAEDPDYVNMVMQMIDDKKVNAECAVQEVSEYYASIFEGMEDAYMKERASDIRDISNRFLAIMQECGEEQINSEEPVILVAEDLSPSRIVQLDKSKIAAFVIRHASTFSHAAILAGNMNIPALVDVDYPVGCDGEWGIVDGYEGVFYIHPDKETQKKMELQQQDEMMLEERRKSLIGKKAITRDGVEIQINANIGDTFDVPAVLKNDADGIGLLRSEFLYLQGDTYPTEEELFQTYKTILEAVNGKRVVIRTLDIGADKQADYFKLPQEENPAMGYRGIRVCMKEQELFRTQLRAIYRAACYGHAAIMYPMVISVEEVQQIKKIAEEVRNELIAEQMAIPEIEQGIMMETPAAVMISDLLAKEVDFFSIGTNDLTQYTLAIDRKNEKAAEWYNPRHEAVIRMIQLVIDNAHKEGCRVAICGELGADTELTETFLRMGLDEVSVKPSAVLSVREKVRMLDLKNKSKKIS